MYQIGAEINLQNATQLVAEGKHAIANGETDFDLSGLKNVDSAAVVVLLDWKRAANQKAVHLRFHDVPPNLLSLMALYGVSELLQ